MILQCPSCNAGFLVADALLVPSGRTVRCGACRHEWFANPPVAPLEQEASSEPPVAAPAPLAEQEPLPEPVPHIVHPRQLPAIARKKLKAWPFATAAGVLVALWFILGYFAYFPALHRVPGFDALYRMAGAINTESLVFNEVKMESVVVEGRTHYIVSGSIANHAYKSRLLPSVRVELKDKKGEVVWSRTYPVEHVIKPGEVYPFRIEDIKTSFAASVSTIVLDIGNSLELMMR